MSDSASVTVTQQNAYRFLKEIAVTVRLGKAGFKRHAA